MQIIPVNIQYFRIFFFRIFYKKNIFGRHIRNIFTPSLLVHCPAYQSRLSLTIEIIIPFCHRTLKEHPPKSIFLTCRHILLRHNFKWYHLRSVLQKKTFLFIGEFFFHLMKKHTIYRRCLIGWMVCCPSFGP